MREVDQPMFSEIREDYPVYRYLTYEKFRDLLCNARTWFSSLKILKDAEEGRLPIPQREKLRAQFEGLAAKCSDSEVKHSLQNYTPNLEARNRKMLFVNCWSRECNSERLWNEYVGAEQGVVVRSTTRRLEVSFAISPNGGNFCSRIVDVVYHDDDLPLHEDRSHDLFIAGRLKRRKDYVHEQEVRVMVMPFAVVGEIDARGSGIYVPTILENLIDKVYVKRETSEWVRRDFRDFMTKAGLAIEIEEFL